MNKLHLLSAGLMAMALTACQQDEPIGADQPTTDASSVATDGKYIAITLANADTYGSRAGESTTADSGNSFEYENGSDDENAISAEKLRFFFYDAYGNPFQMTGTNINSESISTNMIKPVEITSNNVNNTTTEVKNAVLVLGKAVGAGYGGADIPAKVICVANASEDLLKQYYENKSLEEVTNAVHDKVTDGTAGSFVMTSSTYWDNGKVYWSEITANNIKSTPEAATASPVMIYIERLAARVDVTTYPTDAYIYNSDNQSEKMTISYMKWDPTTEQVVEVQGAKIKAQTTGWNVNTLAKKSFGIKNISNFSDSNNGDNYFFTNLADWNVGVRSFWSSTLNGDTQQSATTPELFIPQAEEENDQSLNLTTQKGKYIFANTADPLLQGTSGRGNSSFRGKVNFARTYATKVLVGAKLYIEDPAEGAEATQANEQNEFNMMYWGGAYYTPEALCRNIARWEGKPDDAVVFVRGNGSGNKSATDKEQHFNVKFYWKSGATTGTMVNESEVTPNNAIDIDPALYWNGMCYYIINISNKMKATAKTGQPEMYGVMRNHIYQYKLTKFVGLGTPVSNPEAETDVENPAFGETFVAAQLNVLNWRIVAHETILQ